MFVTATSMVCPVGLNAAAACAALRAKIAAFNELPYCDNQGEPIVGARVPDLELPRKTPQLVELLVQTLGDLTKSLGALKWEKIPLLVCLAEPDRPGGPAALNEPIIRQVQQKLNIQFHQRASRVFTTGHTAAFEALAEARQLLADDSTISGCLIGGVDSLINAHTLLWLEQCFRLKTRANRDGLIPGEAAAAAFLQRKPVTGVATEIVGLGFGQEKSHIFSDEPLLGLGLTAAVRAALGEADLGLHEIDCRLSDVTGEFYGFKELPLVTARLMRVVRSDDQPVWHWSEAIGDIGAAAGIAQLIVADHAFKKRYAPGDRMLGLTSATAGNRAAAVVRRWPRSSKSAKG